MISKIKIFKGKESEIDLNYPFVCPFVCPKKKPPTN